MTKQEYNIIKSFVELSKESEEIDRYTWTKTLPEDFDKKLLRFLESMINENQPC